MKVAIPPPGIANTTSHRRKSRPSDSRNSPVTQRIIPPPIVANPIAVHKRGGLLDLTFSR